MENGTCILVRNRWDWQRPFQSLLYGLIRVLHASPFNHAALIWNDGNQIRVVEAWEKGLVTPAKGWPTLAEWLVRRRRYIQYVNPPQAVLPSQITDLLAQAPLYGYRELPSHTWYTLFGHWWGKPRSRDVMTCGEVVATVWVLPNAHAYSPGRLWREFSLTVTVPVNR